MREYLLFRLYGPMAAWGEIAVGEYRPTFAHPSKSALLGLAAAALGLRRDEEEAHRRLAASLGFAVRVDEGGILLRDYHTIQRPRRGVVHPTRRSELAADNLNTTISTRDYRCDALYTVALWAVEDPPPYGLEDLAEALRRPAFTLYLGRKSCPPALPLNPRVVIAENLKQALSEAEFPDGEMLDGLPRSGRAALYWERGEESGFESEMIITRRDNPISRRRWQFSNREECYAGISPEEG